MSIAKLLPEGEVSNEQAEIVLEIAYLTTAVDGRLDDDELAAFRGVVARLKNRTSVPERDVDALLDRFASNVAHTEILDRVRAIAPKLSTELREVAFKLTIALSLTDMDASDEESELHETLAEVLGLTPSRVVELTADVYSAFDAGD